MREGIKKWFQKASPDLWGSLVVTIGRLLVAEYIVGILVWYFTAHGLADASGTPLGADFINVYAAGIMARGGGAAQVYDWDAHHAVEQAVAHYDVPYFGWHYPPFFLIVASTIAVLPYLWAFAVYMAVSFAGYWTAMRRVMPRTRESFWFFAVFPGIFDNVINGQNGFITAGLLGAGLSMLETSPQLAGFLLGLLAYKPQFFVVIPVMLAVGGYGRVAAKVLVTACGAMILSWGIFGSDVWRAFFDASQLTQHVILEQGVTGWQKIQSVFSWARMWGADVTLAYVAQGFVAIGAVAVAAWIWLRRADFSLRVTALCAAMILATPYVLDYDLIILSVALAFLMRRGMEHGFLSGQKIVMGLMWILPMLARHWGGYLVPLTPPVMMGVLGWCVVRMKEDGSRLAPG